jgi:osmotically-inducible protein OsmY
LTVACSTNPTTKISDQLTSPYITNLDNQKADDISLKNNLQDKLDDAIPNNAIKVVTDHFNVLLVGQVATQTDKDQASVICKQFPGIKKVFNYLTVTMKPSLHVNSSITKDAVARLDHQNDIRGKMLTVVTVEDVVYIMGTNIGNLTALGAAINGIYTIDGVKKVVNLEQPGDVDYTSTTEN